MLDNGQTQCWGLNTHGQLGLGDTVTRGMVAGEMGFALPYVDVGAGRIVLALVAGVAHTCAVLDNARAKCWGLNNNGQLGLGDTDSRGDAPGEMGDALPYVDVGAGRTVVALTAGVAHTCAVLDNARIKCWGLNSYGQLGLGDDNDRGDAAGEMGDALPYVELGAGRTVVALAAGRVHTCAVLDNARAKCWGSNAHGRLGTGDTAHRGRAIRDMGDALPYADVGAGRTVVALVTGAAADHTCALLDNARAKCWGNNAFGQLGLANATHRGGAESEMGDALPYVDVGLGRLVASLAAGEGQTCAVLDNARAKCWGDNTY
eukprot:8160811-Pyramimonas_sp.AAC.1